MARVAREKTETNTYHVMVRGINRQPIFLDSDDNYRFISILKKYKISCNFNLYAYCLMINHVHLVIKENDIPLGVIFKKINTSYALYFNKRHQRCGHLFQDRFRSEPIHDDPQLLQTVRYVHRNPVKAGICEDPSQYCYSSYMDFISPFDSETLTDTAFILDIFGSMKEFRRFTEEKTAYECMDIDQTTNLADKRAI